MTEVTRVRRHSNQNYSLSIELRLRRFVSMLPAFSRWYVKQCDGLLLAGMAGLEPADEGVKVPCLTTWLHPYMVLAAGIEPA